MARRILYNPVDFVEASTPFYDNLIGTITDQTDRISRNIELAREENMRQEDREWQEEMLQKRLDAQRENTAAQLAAQGAQNALSRHQNQMQFLSNQGMQVENLRLEWAKLGRQQLTAQQKAADAEFNEITKNVNEHYGTLRDVGLIASDSPLRLDVVRHPETGDYGVLNMEVDGDPEFYGTADDYIRNIQPLVNFADQFLNGKNVVEWANQNLAKASDYTDVESEGTIVTHDKFMALIHNIRSGQDDGSSVDMLKKIMDQESGVRMLMKEDPDSEFRDPLTMAQNINSIVNTFTGVETYTGLIFDPDDPTKLLDSSIEDEINRYIPSVVDHTFRNLPNTQFKAQSIGQIAESVGLLSAKAGPNDYRVKEMRDASQKLYSMAEQYLLSNPDMIPESLKGLPAYEVARSLRLNPEEITNPSPRYENLFKVPANREEMERLRTNYEHTTNNDDFWERMAKGMNYIDNPKDSFWGN